MKEVSRGKEVDILNWMGRTALELVGQGGLGYSFDPLVATTKNAFGDSLKALVFVSYILLYAYLPSDMFFCYLRSPVIGRCTNYRFFCHHAEKFRPARLRRFLASLIPDSNVQQLKTIIDTMEERSKEILDGKRKALEEGDEAVKMQVGEGKDIMSILCE